jgi:hypothetical protein
MKTTIESLFTQSKADCQNYTTALKAAAVTRQSDRDKLGSKALTSVSSTTRKHEFLASDANGKMIVDKGLVDSVNRAIALVTLGIAEKTSRDTCVLVASHPFFAALIADEAAKRADGAKKTIAA